MLETNFIIGVSSSRACLPEYEDSYVTPVTQILYVVPVASKLCLRIFTLQF
jgi:hypothetical protein